MLRKADVTRTKLLILDFDGTLCHGDDPVLAYAAEADAMLAERGLGRQLRRSVRDITAEAFVSNQLLVPEIAYDDAGVPLAVLADRAAAQETAAQDTAKPHPVSWPLQDGYQLVQLLAQQAGLSAAETGLAFRAARRRLISQGLAHSDVHAPEGVHQLLQELRESAVVVLISNSPAEGFEPWLQVLGLEGAFDTVINGAGKPFGMPAAVEQACAGTAHPVAGRDILSVGDIWLNDLAYVDELGGTTVLIDRFGTGLGAPTHRVSTFEAAASAMRAWAQSSAE